MVNRTVVGGNQIPMVRQNELQIQMLLNYFGLQCPSFSNLNTVQLILHYAATLGVPASGRLLKVGHSIEVRHKPGQLNL